MDFDFDVAEIAHRNEGSVLSSLGATRGCFNEKGIVGLMVKHITEKPPSLFEINPEIPLEVDSIVMRTLIKDPALRPTARELAEEFLKAISLLPEEALDRLYLSSTSAEGREDTLKTLIADELKTGIR